MFTEVKKEDGSDWEVWDFGIHCFPSISTSKKPSGEQGGVTDYYKTDDGD